MILSFVQLFTCKPEKVESGTWEQNNEYNLRGYVPSSWKLCKIHRETPVLESTFNLQAADPGTKCFPAVRLHTWKFIRCIGARKFHIAFHQIVDPFAPNATFLYPLKTSENRKVFWYFHGVEKGCLGNEWLK